MAAASNAWGPPDTIAIKVTPSAVPNGITFLNGGGALYCRKREAYLLPTASLVGGVAANPNTRVYSSEETILQTKWLDVGPSKFIGIAHTGGFKILEEKHKSVVLTHAYNESAKADLTKPFIRGLAAAYLNNGYYILAGTSGSQVIVYLFAAGTFQESRVVAVTEGQPSPISEITSSLECRCSDTVFAVGQDGGHLTIFDSNFSATAAVAFDGEGVTSVRLGKAVVVASYTSGAVRVFDRNLTLLTQINAHSRMVTALAVNCVNGETFASVGLDAILNVWNIDDKGTTTSLLCKEVLDTSLYGVAFVNGAILVAGYDQRALTLYPVA